MTEKNKIRILVVEDEVMVAMVLRRTLERRHYQVCDVATTGQTAIQSARSHQPDLVLLDVNLPGNLDGIEVARCIADQQETRFIFFSGHNAEEIKERIDFLSRFACLMKPVDNDDLIATIEEILLT
jgi:DNA-binding response OmpR family regulator